MAPVYRSPLRSRRDEVEHDRAVEHALAHSLVAVGGVIEPAPRTLDEAVERIASTYDGRAAARLDRFAAAPTGSFVWTRHPDGDLWLGRITGPWRYDSSPTALDLDLPHVRDCTWTEQPVPLKDVPGGVQATFDRGGRNFQRTHGADVERHTAEVWERLT